MDEILTNLRLWYQNPYLKWGQCILVTLTTVCWVVVPPVTKPTLQEWVLTFLFWGFMALLFSLVEELKDMPASALKFGFTLMLNFIPFTLLITWLVYTLNA